MGRNISESCSLTRTFLQSLLEMKFKISLIIFSLGVQCLVSEVKFSLPKLVMNTTLEDIFGKSPQLERIQKVEVGVAPVNVNPEVKLLEHILLKVDFNYL